MNHITLSWQQNLVQILTQYNCKNDQISNSNKPLEEIFQEFIKNYIKRTQQREFQHNLITSRILIISQERMQQEQLLQTQGFRVDQIKEQRQQLLQRLDQRESELQRIEKVLENGNTRKLSQNQFEDLQDGIEMCKEKLQLLQQENIEFTKLAHSLKQQNDQLKSRYSNVNTVLIHVQAREMYDKNLSTLNELQQQGLNLNYRMMKQIKITKDLGQLNQIGASQTRKSKFENFVSNYSQLEDTCITQLNSF
ncbi:unnamed protein product (macronuclear) [Paramecium tetraurelia]|uniref:Uncharacterized protein n=1 Tax=Paramecium tetraurelia TaxID=5888 RepID=A0BWA8_PARTE|nr:uncharacterized protein GSPATT00032677001 [Paramecium tetraurelia]CAK62825.1 unnamed protein product [Paramecium tetraurelia]|eukprot:XP_001430223.1 hypothetical protein (macronuclear) [Paramecium tetraurelia strain d4-2]